MTSGEVGTRGLASSLVVAGVGLIATCYGLARFAYGLFAPQLAEEFQLTAAMTGLIGSGSYVGYCVAIGLSSLATARWGPRRVAVAAGAVAALGTGSVAVATSAPVLAVGVLVAGVSTGIVSPPLAAAVNRWVRERSRDSAQTIVNAGTGIGVLASGPVALLLVAQWRVAWALFAVVAVAMTVWVARVIPPGGSAETTPARGGPRREGVGLLLVAAVVMGMGSIAVWTFSQSLLEARHPSSWVAPVAWTAIGVAGVAGAFSGSLVVRFGVARAWTALMVLMGIGSAGLAVGADQVPIALLAGALFGAAYIALTGVLLVWATRLYPDRAATGVGLAFLVLAVGQAVAAPLVGLLAERTTVGLAFVSCAAVAVAGGLLTLRGWAGSHR